MKKEKGIDLLSIQIAKIQDESITREDWIQAAISIVIRVFPVSYVIKVAQIENLEHTPSYYEDLSKENKIKTQKKKAENLLTNYIEEIELLGMENKHNKLELFFGSFRFWSIIIILCSISYVGGKSSAIASEINSSSNFEMNKLKQEIHEHEIKITKLEEDLDSKKEPFDLE